MKESFLKELLIITLSIIGFLLAGFVGFYVRSVEKDVTRLEARIESVNTTLHQRINRHHEP